VARASTTSDVFNAVGDVHRRAILDVLLTGEKAVGAIVGEVSMSQPQVSRHLRVLDEVGLVRCRAEGRRRLYRLAPEPLRPLHAWVTQYERAINDRLDRIDDYLQHLQGRGEGSGT
jgi:DNA-binding transcriptional ArsR family regulator